MVSRACLTTSAAASIHSQSVWRAGAVVERAAGEAVAVGDLDGVDPGVVERRDDARDVHGGRCGGGWRACRRAAVTSWM